MIFSAPLCFVCWCTSHLLCLVGDVAGKIIDIYFRNNDDWKFEEAEAYPFGFSFFYSTYQWTMSVSWHVQKYAGNKSPWIEIERDNENEVD